MIRPIKNYVTPAFIYAKITFVSMPELAIKEAEGLITNDLMKKEWQWLKEEAERMIKYLKRIILQHVTSRLIWQSGRT